MSPSIELSQQTFKRLQAHAVPLVDTIESVITRMIDAVEKVGAGEPPETPEAQAVRIFNPDSPPDLTHAKILGVTFGAHSLGRGQDNWNSLLHHAVREARTLIESDNAFAQTMLVNHVKGAKHDEGYRPVAGTDISVQGQDANGAWRAACRIAQNLGVHLSVKFAWREKEGAAHPGVTGQMVVNG